MMRRFPSALLSLLLLLALAACSDDPAAEARLTAQALPAGQLADLCADLFDAAYGTPNGEPLGACQWDMALIGATGSGSYAAATGAGVRVGVIDSQRG